MEDPAIKVENVSKTFKLPREKQSSIKGLFVNGLRSKKGYDIQKALDDVSFEVKKGEFFGIVGRNGSGKSTMLKLLAGIYTPSSGDITINGTIVPFIELGVGFNTELSGRENVFLNGSLLGFSRKQMREMYKDIVDFAELSKFMDQKLKNYSSGMQVRLAFSIAIRASGDILLLDEVLAVGDEAFQKKCIDVFENYKAKKQTIILVTHDMGTVRRFCNRAMLLDKGEVQYIGDPHYAAQAYSRINDQATEEVISTINAKRKSKIDLKIKDAAGKVTTSFEQGDFMRVEVRWPKSTTAVKNVGVAIVKNSGEYIFGPNTFGQKLKFKDNNFKFDVKLTIGQGTYHLKIGLFGDSEKEIIEFEEHAQDFLVKKKLNDTSQGIVRLKHTWLE